MARLNWGDDGKLWGDRQLYWGEVDDSVPGTDLALPVWFHALIKAILPSGTVRLWTGGETLRLDFGEGAGLENWLGAGTLIGLTPAKAQAGPATDALTIQINSIPEDQRAMWVLPVGGAECTLRFIASEDYGFSWSSVPIVRHGVLSGPTLSGGVYSVDIVDEYENRSRAHPLTWSDEDQRTRHPGDLGMSGMRTLASGIDLKWPNL